MIEKTALQIYNQLNATNLLNSKGKITFSLAGVTTIVKTTDIVGNTLQSWLKEYFIKNNIFFKEPANTQEFPDFFLSSNSKVNLLEVKSFNFSETPAFDIANFESYCDSIKNKPYNLYADYLIFGYQMDSNGDISIKKIWLKKIWEIAGKSSIFPLKTQIKRGTIYNIRPRSFKNTPTPIFSCEQDFIQAIYETLSQYKNPTFANDWLMTFKNNYFQFYGKPF